MVTLFVCVTEFTTSRPVSHRHLEHANHSPLRVTSLTADRAIGRHADPFSRRHYEEGRHPGGRRPNLPRFCVLFRDNPDYRVVAAFTATQIPDIASPRYRAALAGQ